MRAAAKGAVPAARLAADWEAMAGGTDTAAAAAGLAEGLAGATDAGLMVMEVDSASVAVVEKAQEMEVVARVAVAQAVEARVGSRVEAVEWSAMSLAAGTGAAGTAMGSRVGVA